MRHLVLMTLLALSSPGLAFSEVIHIANEDVTELAASGIPIVDVRTPGEWHETGVVAGSHLLTFFDEKGNYDAASWVAGVKDIADPDDPLILICRSGNRTSQIAAFLDSQVGYSKVYNVQRGIRSWISAGHPIEKPATR